MFRGYGDYGGYESSSSGLGHFNRLPAELQSDLVDRVGHQFRDITVAQCATTSPEFYSKAQRVIQSWKSITSIDDPETRRYYGIAVTEYMRQKCAEVIKSAARERQVELLSLYRRTSTNPEERYSLACSGGLDSSVKSMFNAFIQTKSREDPSYTAVVFTEDLKKVCEVERPAMRTALQPLHLKLLVNQLQTFIKAFRMSELTMGLSWCKARPSRRRRPRRDAGLEARLDRFLEDLRTSEPFNVYSLDLLKATVARLREPGSVLCADYGQLSSRVFSQQPVLKGGRSATRRRRSRCSKRRCGGDRKSRRRSH